jgi:hypothetical protein
MYWTVNEAYQEPTQLHKIMVTREGKGHDSYPTASGEGPWAQRWVMGPRLV